MKETDAESFLHKLVWIHFIVKIAKNLYVTHSILTYGLLNFCRKSISHLLISKQFVISHLQSCLHADVHISEKKKKSTHLAALDGAPWPGRLPFLCVPLP